MAHSVVRTTEEDSKAFNVKVELCQGSVLIPLLSVRDRTEKERERKREIEIGITNRCTCTLHYCFSDDTDAL